MSLQEGDLTSDIGTEGGLLGEGSLEGAISGTTISRWGLLGRGLGRGLGCELGLSQRARLGYLGRKSGPVGKTGTEKEG